MVDAVSYQVDKRVAQTVDNRLVQLGLSTLRGQFNLFVQIS